MGTMRFLTTTVDEAWYQELENSETFYTEVTAFALMERLCKHSGGRNAIDAVDIMSDMNQYFDDAARISVYINMCESFTKRKDSHKDKATVRNIMGGSDWNKGWGG